ncbi:peptidyl-prolyl cis-trans isomerase [Marinobacter sp.]|uniref:peptidylprolyl isomerase n=1 Tax=Marinobacter sp. TaxID=50741 RepID=UPI0019F11054|nr:peptidyl-prolyl cis-trans isomerase [Marinobacter sp.]MBE0485478.1 peptidyl-prolyl cis-trans isomerase [Marinobacter sp.]
MPKQRLLIYSSILILVFAGAGFYLFKISSESYLPSDAVARIGGTVITGEQLKEYMWQRKSASNSMEAKELLLRELVEREAQIAAARELGYEQDPEVVRATENALIARLRARQLNPELDRTEVSEQEISRYYETNISRYTTPAQKRAAIIRFDLPATAPADRITQVTELTRRVQELATSQPDTVRGFGSLAAKYSQDQGSRYVGGDIGWHSATSQNLDPALLSALLALESPGEMAPVVRGNNALYLLKLLDARDQVVTPLDKVASNIHVILLQQKRQQRELAWVESTVERVTPSLINVPVLSALVVTGNEDVALVRPPNLPE